MCRDFSCERKIEDSGTIALRDPLIINFDGKAAELSGKRFSFDLDVDGKAESMFGLGSSSGYLAIDDNNDGRPERWEVFSGGRLSAVRYDSNLDGTADREEAIPPDMAVSSIWACRSR